MDACEFTDRLGRLSAIDIERVAADLRSDLATADGEIGWWRATVAVGCTLKRRRCTREAGLAAHDASAAVLRRAEHLSLLDTDHDRITLVARAAADIARALVATDQVDAAGVGDHIRRLLTPWRSVLSSSLRAA